LRNTAKPIADPTSRTKDDGSGTCSTRIVPAWKDGWKDVRLPIHALKNLDDGGAAIEIGGCARARREAILSISLATCFIGCTDGGRPLTVPIHGRVTLENADWPKAGTVYFLPIEPAPNLPRRAASATFGTDGRFSSPTSWTEGDGIVPGRYRVYVECWKVEPTRAGPPPVGYAAAKYQSGATSDIEVEITPESDGETFEWDFPASEK
jgi:hypothetical protein